MEGKGEIEKQIYPIRQPIKHTKSNITLACGPNCTQSFFCASFLVKRTRKADEKMNKKSLKNERGRKRQIMKSYQNKLMTS